MPGSWGTFKGLPVRADAASILQEMGIKMLRFGGSYVNSVGMEWKVVAPIWLLFFVCLYACICLGVFAFHVCNCLFRIPKHTSLRVFSMSDAICL